MRPGAQRHPEFLSAHGSSKESADDPDEGQTGGTRARRPRSPRRSTGSHTEASRHNRYARTSRPSSHSLRPQDGFVLVAAPPRRETPFWPQLVELYGSLTTQRRRHLFVLLALMLAGAIAELATIGSLFPFLSLLAGVEQPARAPSLARIFAAAGATTPRQPGWVATATHSALHS